jgi:hypothetical protein
MSMYTHTHFLSLPSPRNALMNSNVCKCMCVYTHTRSRAHTCMCVWMGCAHQARKRHKERGGDTEMGRTESSVAGKAQGPVV